MCERRRAGPEGAIFFFSVALGAFVGGPLCGIFLYSCPAPNGFRQDDPAATEQLFSQIGAAFLEDKTVVR